MAALFKIRTLLTGVGVVLLALFVWYAGPLFAFGPYRPLASELVRLIVIALIIVGMVVARLLKRLRANKASDNLIAAVVKQSQTTDSKHTAEAQQLRERFEEAVATLKQKRRSGHSLYDLPWYVIIGAPGSGKTTALVNSGLKFPTEQRSGKAALRGVGGTRNCDWWFTDQAVLLDTAGRYTTQDSDASADSAAWSEFLALLRKYRGRRPINGVILTISAPDLMVQGAAAREAHVAAARRRLDELNRELRMQLPVYIMVTKCDLVAGFTEYFDDQAQQGRAQVWGVTFPYEETVKGVAAQAFPEELDGLVARLNERLMPRLEEERDVRRRARVFGFPQQMAALRDPLSQFVSDVFSSTRFDRPLLLRGVYFTSGTQEGTPIDRLLGAIGRQFAIAPESVITPGGRGKAYFIERLLTDVMFAESGLAGVNRRVEVQKGVLQLAAYVAMILIAVVGVAVLTGSYRANRSYITEIETEVNRLRATAPAAGGSGSLESRLPRLDAIRAVEVSANRYAEAGAPLSMRWGLFQGDAIGDAARDAYALELNDVFLTQVTARFRQRLLDYSTEPEKLYEYLKGYLMLGDPEHFDPEQLAYLADQEWEAAYGASSQIRDSVAAHFRSLLQSGQIRQQSLDNNVVAQARNSLGQASKAGLVYRYLKIERAKDTGRALRLDLEAGLSADRVLRRKSGVSLSTPLPSLYTKDVFNEIASTGSADLVKQFADEQWVWGSDTPAMTASASLMRELLEVYEKDYISFWDRIVGDIEPLPMGSLRNTKEALAILAGPASPLRLLLKAVDKHTFLVAPKDPAAATSGIKGRLADVFNSATGRLDSQTTAPGSLVTAHFADFHRLVTGEGGAAPIDSIIRTLEQIQQKLAPLGDDVGGKPPDANSMREIGELANTLKRDAAPLPPAVGAVVAAIANSSLSAVRVTGQRTVGTTFVQNVLNECRALVNGRYPFVAGSSTDIPIADFERLFGPNGVFDTYFKTELQDLVNKDLSTWTWRTDASGAPVGGGVPLTLFESAERIREMFFRSSKAELRFTVTADGLDRTSTRFTLEIDGQEVRNRHDPPRPWPMTWPGPKPGLASSTFEPSGGPNFAFEGPWALFRLLESGRLERESDVRYLLTLQRGSREVQLRIEADSVRNPFGKSDLQRFRCE